MGRKYTKRLKVEALFLSNNIVKNSKPHRATVAVVQHEIKKNPLFPMAFFEDMNGPQRMLVEKFDVSAGN